MNNDMEIINKFLKSKNENLERIKKLSGELIIEYIQQMINILLSLKITYLLWMKIFILVNLGKSLSFAEIYFKIIFGDEKLFMAMKKLF